MLLKMLKEMAVEEGMSVPRFVVSSVLDEMRRKRLRRERKDWPKELTINAVYSMPFFLRQVHWLHAYWSLTCEGGLFDGKDLSLRLKTEPESVSWALIETDNGYTEIPSVSIHCTDEELKNFRLASLQHDPNLITKVTLKLERPKEYPDFVPYSVKGFEFSLHSRKRVPHGVTVH